MRMVAKNLWVPIPTELVLLRRSVSIEGLQIRNDELRHIRPIARRQCLSREVILQRVVRLERRGRRHVALDRVIECRNVRRALDRGMAAQRHDTRTRPADISQQQLQQRAGTDYLDAVRVLRPGNGISKGRRFVRARTGQNGLSNFQKRFLGATGSLLHYLRRVACEMRLDDLKNTAGVLERLVSLRRRFYERRHQRVKQRTYRGFSSCW